jgi:uncharacterized protein
MKAVDSDGFLRGITLFNHAEFFEAHEVLEDVWRAAPGEQKKFLQGLIQVAVAFHHHSTGNRVGARSLLHRGMRNLDGYPDNFGGIQLAVFLKALVPSRHALDNNLTLPPPPRIRSVET